MFGFRLYWSEFGLPGVALVVRDPLANSGDTKDMGLTPGLG